MKGYIFYFIGALSILLCGCGQKKYIEVPIPVEKVQYVDRYINKTDSFIKTDSVYLHDSISVYVRGDTVYQDKWHYKDRIKIVNTKSKDTVLVTKVDSVPKIVYKYVAKDSTIIRESIVKKIATCILLGIICMTILSILAKLKKK